MINQQFFQQDEFQKWANLSPLFPSEQFVTKNFLAPEKNTLEAGTGAGRILFQLAANQFTDLAGFDYLPEFIELAKQNDPAEKIDFRVQNAVELDYPDESFAQVLYLQQVLCFIESPPQRQAAAAEAFRILQPGGRAIFSFLCYESREKNRVSAAFTHYLKVLRTLTRSRREIQNQPWLRSNDKPNFAALLDKPPHVYWFKLAEIFELLQAAGFKIRAAGSDGQLHNNTIFTDYTELNRATCEGTVYVVCDKA